MLRVNSLLPYFEKGYEIVSCCTVCRRKAEYCRRTSTTRNAILHVTLRLLYFSLFYLVPPSRAEVSAFDNNIHLKQRAASGSKVAC